MKKAVHFFLLVGFIGSTLISCNFLEDFERGNGNITTRHENTPYFNKVRIGGNFDVTLEKAGKSGIRVITDENLQPFIQWEVDKNLLNIHQEKKLISKSKIRIIIEYEHIEEMRVTGAAMLQNEGYIEEKELNLRMDGAGMVDIRIRTEFLKVMLSGAGIVKLAGEAEREELNLSGAGSLKAFDLESKSCKVVVGGIGGAEIYVTEDLNASIEGIGGIKYEGNPMNIQTEINGLGKIRPAENN
jgi:hypothetical protein